MPLPSSPDVVAGHYDRLARTYDTRWRGYLRHTLARALTALDGLESARVLDLGCGTGELARLAVVRYPQMTVVGVDVSPHMVDAARRKLSGSPRAQFHCGRVEQLPFAAGTFDGVLCANMLHHVADAGRVLEECRHVLRPGGRLVIVDWCRDFWHCQAMHLWLRLVDHTYAGMYRVEELRSLVSSHGFTVTQAGRFLAPPCYGMCWVNATVASAEPAGGRRRL